MITKESAIRALLREALATTPSSTPHGNDEKQQLPSTVPSELPIYPSDQSATQLSTQRPPVEDPTFIPANQEELGESLKALSQLVPDSMIERFYRQFVVMVDKSCEVDAKEASVGE